MQLRIDRYTLMIIPETQQDLAFIEDTMGMRDDGDIVKLERIDDGTDNWIKFRLESFIGGEDEPYEPRTTKSKLMRKSESKKFKNIDGSYDEKEVITQVDIDALD